MGARPAFVIVRSLHSCGLYYIMFVSVRIKEDAMKEQKDATYTVSVMASVKDVARLGLYFDKIGAYRAAKPAGMLGVAIRFLVNILDGSGDLHPVDSLNEALRIWGGLRYPREQLDAQLRRQQVASDRASLRAEAVETYSPAAKVIARVRKEIYDMTEEERAQLLRASEEAALSPAEKAAIKAEGLRHAIAAGTVVSDDTRSMEEINAERAAIDAERLAREKENMLAQLNRRTAPTAEDDEFAEFTAVAATIEQPYVLNVEPAPFAPGALETQEELRREAGEESFSHD
jgi:hypothetical protein